MRSNRENGEAALQPGRRKFFGGVATCVVLLTGCIGDTVPFAYDGLEDSGLAISKSTLQRIIDDHLTREETIRLLGKPDGTNSEVRSIGYERCTDSKGYTSSWFFVPVWVRPVDVMDCQRAGVWFDDQDRAHAWDATRETGEAVGFSTSLDEWLAVPGGSRGKK